MSLWRFPKEIISFPNTKYHNDTTKTGFYLFLASLSRFMFQSRDGTSHCISVHYLIEWYAG